MLPCEHCVVHCNTRSPCAATHRIHCQLYCSPNLQLLMAPCELPDICITVPLHRAGDAHISNVRLLLINAHPSTCSSVEYADKISPSVTLLPSNRDAEILSLDSHTLTRAILHPSPSARLSIIVRLVTVRLHLYARIVPAAPHQCVMCG